MGKDVLTVKN